MLNFGSDFSPPHNASNIFYGIHNSTRNSTSCISYVGVFEKEYITIIVCATDNAQHEELRVRQGKPQCYKNGKMLKISMLSGDFLLA